MKAPPDIAIALDHPTLGEALAVVEAAGAQATWYKVGPVLFAREGPDVVRELLRRGKRVFLDLKWHDIPNTVAGAVAAAAGLGVHMATVHLAGGRAMLESAAAARGGEGLMLVGVGVLTSLDEDTYGYVVGRKVESVAAEQKRLSALAVSVGLDGMVCAASDAPTLRATLGSARLLVVPGIRRPGEPGGGQVRTATPAEAARAGADLLVVGRPITAARDPAKALAEFKKAMAA